MTFNDSPCHYCEEHRPHCHNKGNCERHDLWKSEENRKNSVLRAQKNVSDGFVETSTASFNRHVIKGEKAW